MCVSWWGFVWISIVCNFGFFLISSDKCVCVEVYCGFDKNCVILSVICECWSIIFVIYVIIDSFICVS